MHVLPTPVGGGLALVAAFVVVVILCGRPSAEVAALLAGAVCLSAISAIDHYRPLWPITRLAVQTLVVAVSLSLLPDNLRLLPAISVGAERVGLAVAWLWLINLTNFMDGIDGIAGAEAAAVSLGVALLFSLAAATDGAVEGTIGFALGGASLGYLLWNWAPARIFMGDAGAIPLGFVLGWLLLKLAASGAWAAAIILPGLFVADATVTLLRRLLSGHAPWTPHRTHFYQRAVLGGATAPEVVGFMSACNLALILLALWGRDRPLSVLAAGVSVAVLFLVFLSQRARANGR